MQIDILYVVYTIKTARHSTMYVYMFSFLHVASHKLCGVAKDLIAAVRIIIKVSKLRIPWKF